MGHSVESLLRIVVISRMESKRQLQVAELIKRNLGWILQQEGTYLFGSEPLVTVTSVKVSPDMSVGKVYLSVFNTENKQAVLLEMEEHKYRIKQLLAGRLRRQIRRIPNIELFLDDTLDEMYRLNELFNKLEEDDQMGEEKDQELD